MNASDLTPDSSVVNDPDPEVCPFCKHTGPFDYQGDIPDTVEVTRTGITKTFETASSAWRCPNCTGRFEMLTTAKEV